MIDVIARGLFVGWGLLLAGGFALGRPTADHLRRMPAWTRMASSIALVGAAWLIAAAAPPPASRYAVLIALGMSAGLIGDLLLAGWFGPERPIVAGMSAFGVGHLFYFSAIAPLAAARISGLGWIASLGGWWLVGAIGWRLTAARADAPRLVRFGSLPYALLLVTTAGVATALALVEPGARWLALGAALFVVSDLILALQLFRGFDRVGVGDLVWLTYGPAQALIVASTWFLFG